MKQEILLTANRIVRKGFVTALIISALFFNLIPYAGNSQEKLVAYRNNPVIRYMGTVGDKLIFQVELEHVTENNLFVSIKDDEGTLLFTERVKDMKFSKKFAFEKEEFRDRKITFEVNSPKSNTAQTFQVSQNLRLIEDVVTTRH